MAYVLGLDGGIASIGWALLDDRTPRIVAAGAWCFDAPEQPDDRTPLAAIRRQHRGQRRVLRRRRQRMAKLRQLFVDCGLLLESGREALRHRDGCDPWSLRVEALRRPLSAVELALALGHIARHRGFRSNSKRDHGSNAPSETSEMLKAVAATTESLQGRTVAQMAVEDTQWRVRKRNRGDYTRTVLRSDLQSEVNAIFAAQRRLGSPHAAAALQDAYLPIAFDQLPLQDSDDRVGFCSHEPLCRRTAKRAPSFELFRLLARLRNLRLLTAAGAVDLTPDDISAIVDGFGKEPKLTFKTLRKRLDLAIGVTFEGVPVKDEGTRDVAARMGGAAEGTHALREVLGEPGWRALASFPDKLDRAAEILTFREDLGRIGAGLAEIGMEAWCAGLLTDGVAAGRFARFKGAAHISARAARAVNEGLLRGLPVHEAFGEAGYDHAARPAATVADVANPVARKALGQMLRQVRTVISEHRHLFGERGLPDRIHVELARDVGRGQEERDKITRGLERRTRDKERLRDELRELFPGSGPGGEDLLRFELWKEQGRTCLYTGRPIPPDCVLAADNSVQVDHILPWSRFGDDSFRNKALVFAAANQDKKDRTPFEWLGADSAQWTLFSARVEACKEMPGGKKAGHYLRRNAREVEERFRTRNLNDTRYACRLLLDVLARLYPAGERQTEADAAERHVFARPGALVAKLRQSWGLEGRKKGVDGKRLPDDRHHALDAIIVAACSESLLQRLTRRVQQTESVGRHRPFMDVPEPWSGFREQAQAALETVFVGRPERRRARGKAHDATIFQVRERDGATVLFGRKAVEALTLKDIDRIKDGGERNAPLAASLRAWIEIGKPKLTPPRSPKGDIIRKVRLRMDKKREVEVRGGSAGRGDMARVDVFRETRAGKAARYHLVPVYPHHIAQASYATPPNRAIVAFKDEDQWTDVSRFEFMFSLYQNSLVSVVNKGAIITGYFKGVDRSTATIAIAEPTSQQAVRTGIGSKTLNSFRKFTVDRLGRVSEIPLEIRTWHGAACI